METSYHHLSTSKPRSRRSGQWATGPPSLFPLPPPSSNMPDIPPQVLEASDGEEYDLERHGTRGQRSGLSQDHALGGLKPWLWTICAAIAAVSTKLVMVDCDWHFPAHLLWGWIFCAETWMLIGRSLEGNTGERKIWRTLFGMSGSSMKSKEGDTKWLWRTMEVVCAAVALPLLLQAVLHFPNLPTLATLSLLVFIVDSTAVQIFLPSFCTRCTVFRTAFAALACAAVLYDEYRLQVNGLVFGILSLTFLGLSKALNRRNAFEATVHTTVYMKTGTSATVLHMAFGVMTIWILLASDTLGDLVGFWNVPILVFIVNLLSGATALGLGLEVLLPQNSAHDVSTASSPLPSGFHGVYCTLFTGMAACLSILFTGRAYASSVQIFAFVVALVSLVDFGQLGQVFPLSHGYRSVGEPAASSDPPFSGSQLLSRVLPTSMKTFANDARSWLRRWIAVLILGMISVSWSLFILENFGVTSWTASTVHPNASLDLDFKPVSQLDIVISMYKEPAEDVKSIMSSLSTIPSIGSASPRLIIYNKNPDTDLDALKEATQAYQVIAAPNVGREGETYLRHIVESYDSNLAKHTIFLQADIHNPREFLPRVHDYFDPERTGMLSLGFSGNICDCHSCSDRWGWREYSSIVKDVYEEAYAHNDTTATCEKVLLSYKGQFIASGRRIRGVRKKLYEQLQSAMLDENSWAHGEDYLRGRKDTMDAPWFGYTMERLWSTLLQCSDEEVAWRCPTLLSGVRRGGGKGDCQCFDDV
ncbi:hypothetical protein K402DRAFT_463445 [Aulographum hederae CBS 113979]|uniref:Uncharacterized protein n=1 Tax=Aulographum hederae CBS 113979 TaxID=1176131 RepID=A0A6G1GZV5_9PEZI|nr:hypothetical protein K402DRAFT_463445 [Aulographum hederae CBS 113979]